MMFLWMIKLSAGSISLNNSIVRYALVHPILIKSAVHFALPRTAVFDPNAKAIPLTKLDLPDPLGPTMTLSKGPARNSTSLLNCIKSFNFKDTTDPWPNFLRLRLSSKSIFFKLEYFFQFFILFFRDSRIHEWRIISVQVCSRSEFWYRAKKSKALEFDIGGFAYSFNIFGKNLEIENNWAIKVDNENKVQM